MVPANPRAGSRLRLGSTKERPCSDCGHLQPKRKTTHGTHSPRENNPLREVTNRRRDVPVGRTSRQSILRILTRKKRWPTKKTKVGHRFYRLGLKTPQRGAPFSGEKPRDSRNLPVTPVIVIRGRAKRKVLISQVRLLEQGNKRIFLIITGIPVS